MARVEDQTILEAQVPVSPINVPSIITKDIRESSAPSLIDSDLS